MDSLLVEAPVREQTVIVVDPTPEQQVIMEMIELVKAGEWCRNTLHDDDDHHCALGLVEVAMRKRQLGY